jgi:hypothetical protein
MSYKRQTQQEREIKQAMNAAEMLASDLAKHFPKGAIATGFLHAAIKLGVETEGVAEVSRYLHSAINHIEHGQSL